ncbi:hypothetical protein F2Q68_00028326 [Brassica cretica]|uniref:O-acyltransferase WSD1 C-terminal domain-containing protein n=1 Tax=Brassica cretica TaxID=69181 RepID=A0A8S9I8N1_BRACR|nr:hypothetical protein F2Q68_00028326 [Brassica cretica]
MKKGKYMASEEEERGAEEPLSHCGNTRDMDSKNKKKGEPVWVPVRIQVESHVIVPDLDHVNIENPEDFIEDYCSTIVNTSMDMSIPPWEFHVLNLKTSNAESVDTKSDLSSESMDEIQPKKVIHRIMNFDDVKLVKNIMQMCSYPRAEQFPFEAGSLPVRYGVIKLTMELFGEKVVQAIPKRLFDHTTLTYSNVMGPDEEKSIFDHPISYLAASALTGSQVLNIHFVSYVNKLTISLAVDATVIPDPRRLCDDLVESLNIIKSTALEKFRIS